MRPIGTTICFGTLLLAFMQVVMWWRIEHSMCLTAQTQPSSGGPIDLAMGKAAHQDAQHEATADRLSRATQRLVALENQFASSREELAKRDATIADLQRKVVSPASGVAAAAAAAPQRRGDGREAAAARTVRTKNANFMTMCMPSTPRGPGIEYLPKIVEALVQQMRQVSVLVDTQLKLVVMNTRPGQHAIFDAAKVRFAQTAGVVFEDMPLADQGWVDPSKFEPNNMNNPKQLPGGEVRHQTHDLQALLSVCGRAEHRGDYTLLLEDDFLPCPFALWEIVRALDLMPACRPVHDWKTLSFSQGMNAIALPTERALGNLTWYLGEMRDVRPPDILVYDLEWAYWGKRIGYRHHIFEHVGDISSFDFRKKLKFQKQHAKERSPGCYAERTGHIIAGYLDVALGTGVLTQPRRMMPQDIIAPCTNGGPAPDALEAFAAFGKLRDELRSMNMRLLPAELRSMGGAIGAPRLAAPARSPSPQLLTTPKTHTPWVEFSGLACGENQDSVAPPNAGAVNGALSTCRAQCDRVADCHSVSYNSAARVCFLKKACGVPKLCAAANSAWHTHYYTAC